MPEKETIERTDQDARQGKSPGTQAGEFVREEMHHMREGKHGARSAKQAVAIGLSKARRSGVSLKPPRRGRASARTRRKQASRDYRRGRGHARRQRSARRSRATREALRREGRSAASRRSLARQARSSARSRGSASRHRSAKKAVRTKARSGLLQAARKAARTRRAHARR